MRMSAIGRPTETGFTLIELAVVLALAVALLAVAALAPPDFSERTTDAHTDALVGFLKSAKASSLQQGEIRSIRLDQPGLQIAETRDGFRDSGITGISAFEGSSAGRKLGRLVFYPDGSSTDAIIVVEFKGGRRRLHLDWMGRIHVL